MNKITVPVLATLMILSSACANVDDLSETAAPQSDPAVSADAEATTSTVAVVSDAPEGLASIEDPEEDSTTTTATSTTTTAPPPSSSTTTTSEAPLTPPSCDAPSRVGYFVDVAIDDPDGGLNYRESPGTDGQIITTFTRGVEVIPSGECVTLGTTDWWEVFNTDGSLTGWVSSSYLSDEPLSDDFIQFVPRRNYLAEVAAAMPESNPGLGAAEADADNVGLLAPNVDELAAALASNYGFDDDVEIVQMTEFIGGDATSGEITYDLIGLKDDSVGGYRVQLLVFIERDEADGGYPLGVTATRITRQALCTRGVTDAGLCT